MASAISSTNLVENELNPWTFKVVTPSDSLIANFEEWGKTKSIAPRLRSFNRAKKWISNLLKHPFKVPEAHKLRHIDTCIALEHMINATAMPGGVTYEDYLRSCLAPALVKEDVKATPECFPNPNLDINDVKEVSEVSKISGGDSKDISGGDSKFDMIAAQAVSGGTPATDTNDEEAF